MAMGVSGGVLSILARNVLKRRKALEWSQQELAEASGMSLTTINRLEKEKQKPRVDNLRQIAKALGCLPEDLYQLEAGESVGSLAQIIADQENSLDEKEADIRSLQTQLMLRQNPQGNRVASSRVEYQSLSSTSTPTSTHLQKVEELCQKLLLLNEEDLSLVKEFLGSSLKSKKD